MKDNRMNILEIFNIMEYAELLPIALISFLICSISDFSKEGNTFGKAIKNILYATSLAVIVFMCLSATGLPYLARVGISCLVAFLGIDQFLSVGSKFLDTIRSAKSLKE